MIVINLVDASTQLPKDNAYSHHLSGVMSQWAAATGTEKGKGKEDGPAYKESGYAAGQFDSMGMSILSDSGSTSKFAPTFSIAIEKGIILAICKTTGKKISLVVSMPDDIRGIWPSPSPVSCLMAEFAYRCQSLGQISLDTENDALIEVYERYGFKKTGNRFGTRTEMSLDSKGIAGLCAKYAKERDWKYTERQLPKYR